MSVQFDGFNQSQSVHPLCRASAFGTGYSYYRSGVVYSGGRGALPATSNSTLTIPASATNTLCLWFIGSAQMYLQSDWMPATGVGNWDVKLNIVAGATFGGVTWESISIMLGGASCSTSATVYQQSGLGISITSSGVKTHSFKAALAQTWGSTSRLYYCFGFGNTNGTAKSLFVKYNQIMRYPRPGENRLGLGTGIIHRGINEDVPITAKAHAMVGQP